MSSNNLIFIVEEIILKLKVMNKKQTNSLPKQSLNKIHHYFSEFKDLIYCEGVTESAFLKDLLKVTLLLNPTL